MFISWHNNTTFYKIDQALKKDDKMNTITNFQIAHLDHVAIRIKDMNQSAKWYEDVLGLQRCETPEWGDFPIFLWANETGIALFPADISHPQIDSKSRNVKIDHFAFRVTKVNFGLAIKKYQELDLNYSFQDHHYFQSIYTKDSDGHTVELTTLVIPLKK